MRLRIEWYTCNCHTTLKHLIYNVLSMRSMRSMHHNPTLGRHRRHQMQVSSVQAIYELILGQFGSCGVQASLEISAPKLGKALPGCQRPLTPLGGVQCCLPARSIPSAGLTAA